MLLYLLILIILILFATFKNKHKKVEPFVVEPFVDTEESEIFFIDLSKDKDKDLKKNKNKNDRIKALEKQHAELKAMMLQYNRNHRNHRKYRKQVNEAVLQKERALVKEQNMVKTAIAKAILNGDKVSHINILDAGGNYTAPPTILFSGGDGRGATALAKIRDGHVVAIELTSGGTGYTQPPNVIFNREAFCGTNPVETVKSIESKAKEFNKIHKEHVKDIETRVKKAKKRWAPMLKIIKEDKKIASQAKSLGLPPPPSLYTDKQIKAVQKELKLKPRNLTASEKAKCMDLSNETKKVVESVEFLTRQGLDIPALRPQALKKAELLEKLKKEYKNKCA